MDKIFGFSIIIIICILGGLQGYSHYLDIQTKKANIPIQKVVTVYDTVRVKYNEDVNSVGKDIGQMIDTIYLKGGELWKTGSDYVYSLGEVRELQNKVEDYTKKIEDYEVQDKGFGLKKSTDSKNTDKQWQVFILALIFSILTTISSIKKWDTGFTATYSIFTIFFLLLTITYLL